MSAEPAVIRANLAARMAADDVHRGVVCATFADLARYTERASAMPKQRKRDSRK